MIEDVYEPLARYRDDFKAKFAALTRAKFKELTTASGIDVAANRRLIALIHELERKVESASGKKTLLGLGVALFFLAALACLVVFFLLEGNPNRSSWLLGCLAGLLLGVYNGISLSPALFFSLCLMGALSGSAGTVVFDEDSVLMAQTVGDSSCEDRIYRTDA